MIKHKSHHFASEGTKTSLRVGVNASNFHLTLASAWDLDFGNIDVEFISYSAGRNSAELLRSGEIDICGTSSTQPLLAADTGLDVMYVAASAQRRLDGSVVVPAHSSFWSLRDLAGCTIGLACNSFQMYLLVEALEKEKLTLNDITLYDLMPGEGLSVLRQKKIDALVTLAPYQEYALAEGNIRVLEGSKALIPNRSVFWTLKKKNLGAYTLASFFDAMEYLGVSIHNDVARAASILAAGDTNSSFKKAWRKAIVERDWTIHRINKIVLQELQDESDMLFRNGILKTHINIIN